MRTSTSSSWREEARKRKTTLDSLFRVWLEDLATRDQRRQNMRDIFQQMKDFDSGGPFTREQMDS